MLKQDVVNRAELDLMACLLVEPHKTIKEIRGVVYAADFLNPAAKAIYEVVLALADGDKVVDPTMILAHAAQQGSIVDCQSIHRTAIIPGDGSADRTGGGGVGQSSGAGILYA